MRSSVAASCVVLVLVSGCSTSPLTHASARFDTHAVTIEIPLDAKIWGGPMRLQEGVGLAFARAYNSLSFMGSVHAGKQRLPERSPGAFGLYIPAGDVLDDAKAFDRIDFVVWPAAAFKDDDLMLTRSTDDSSEPNANTDLVDQIRRTTHSRANRRINLLVRERTIVIRDYVNLYERFEENRPRSIRVYVSRPDGRLERAWVRVTYPSAPKPDRRLGEE